MKEKDKNTHLPKRWSMLLDGDSDWESFFNKKSDSKKAYDYLREFKEIRNFYSSNTPVLSPYSNRVNYIIDQLNKIGVQYQVDIFNTSSPYSGSYSSYTKFEGDSPSLVNIIVEINSHLRIQDNKNKAIVFCAHHDVNNTHSENCQDNSASVCNLLYLTSLLQKTDNLPTDKRIIILFTDCEEFGGKGASRFASKLQHNSKPWGEIEYIVNLELTGLGKNIWMDTENVNNKKELSNSKLLKDINNSNVVIKDVNTPFSDSIVFRRHNIDSFCFGILPDEEINGGHKKTWRLCHSNNDTFDKISEMDMNNFVEQFLLPFAIGKNIGDVYLKKD